MGSYSIKELEKLSKVKAHTIRIWEKRYGLLSPERSETNIRSYSDDDLRKLLNVSVLNDNGFKISKIATMSDPEMNKEVLALEAREGHSVDQVESLVIAMTNLDEERFERVIGNCILREGFERTMLEVIQPFLRRVGVLWQIDAIKPGQEHFISNLVRQKVIAAIDGVVPTPNDRPRTVLFFLPEGELHELGLLFGHFLARKAGHRSIYLGQSVPFADLKAIVEHRAPTDMVTGMLAYHRPREIASYLKKLHAAFPSIRVWFFHDPRTGEIPTSKGQEVVSDLSRLRDILA